MQRLDDDASRTPPQAAPHVGALPLAANVLFLSVRRLATPEGKDMALIQSPQQCYLRVPVGDVLCAAVKKWNLELATTALQHIHQYETNTTIYLHEKFKSLSSDL